MWISRICSAHWKRKTTEEREPWPQKRIGSLISFCGLAVGVFQKLANYKKRLFALWSLLCCLEAIFEPNKICFWRSCCPWILHFLQHMKHTTRLNYESWLEEFIKQVFQATTPSFIIMLTNFLAYCILQLLLPKLRSWLVWYLNSLGS